MLLLSPPKLLIILVIALIVLGPDKLPSTARRIGALWSDVKRWRSHLENEVRATFPDLPSTTEIARVVRSPLSMLDRLADGHGATSDAEPAVEIAGPAGAPGPTPGAPGAPPVTMSADPDSASMN
jgi:sec-independent protein translocase protein TatB